MNVAIYITNFIRNVFLSDYRKCINNPVHYFDEHPAYFEYHVALSTVAVASRRQLHDV